MKLTTKDFTDSDITATKFERHFKDVSKDIGYEVKPPEIMINALGYQAMGSKQFKQAESLFKLNVANYPTSLNVYDSYGDYFAAIGDKDNAIAQYKKALTVGDNPGTKKKLDQLVAGK